MPVLTYIFASSVLELCLHILSSIVHFCEFYGMSIVCLFP